MSDETRGFASGNNASRLPGKIVASDGTEPPTGNKGDDKRLSLSRSLVTASPSGVISQKEFEYLVTSQFEYQPLLRGNSGMSESLVAAFNPYGAKGRAIRYLAARIKMETAAEKGLCFSVAGAHRKCGATYIAANLAIAFSEFGLRTLLIDANVRRPGVQQLFACAKAPGLTTRPSGGATAADFVIRLESFRDLSLLPAGRSSVWRSNELRNDFLAYVVSQFRENYDIVICDSSAMSTTGDDCQVTAAICRNVLSVLRKDRTRVSLARSMLTSLDAVGTRQLGSVLCQF